jgi:rubrerythrin
MPPSVSLSQMVYNDCIRAILSKITYVNTSDFVYAIKTKLDTGPEQNTLLLSYNKAKLVSYIGMHQEMRFEAFLFERGLTRIGNVWGIIEACIIHKKSLWEVILVAIAYQKRHGNDITENFEARLKNLGIHEYELQRKKVLTADEIKEIDSKLVAINEEKERKRRGGELKPKEDNKKQKIEEELQKKREELERQKEELKKIEEIKKKKKIEENECKICYSSEINSVFVPCGHMATCFECGNTMTKCPICRSEYAYFIRTFK